MNIIISTRNCIVIYTIFLTKTKYFSYYYVNCNIEHNFRTILFHDEIRYVIRNKYIHIDKIFLKAIEY